MSLSKALTAAAGNAGGGDNLYVEDVFSTYLYAGNASTQNIPNGIDLAGEGGLVWIKDRTTAFNHALQDTERWTLANNNILSTNLIVGSQTYTNSITSFNADGFTLGSNSLTNATGPRDFASWSFRKAEKFFDIVTYTGDGASSRTIAHSLGSVPAFMTVKSSSHTSGWRTYHASLGATQYIQLQNTSAAATYPVWDDTTPTDSVFSISLDVNANGVTYVAYLFASDAGGFGDDGTENIIKCGSYTGNGSVDGTEVDCGFEPQFLLLKAASTTGNWLIYDSMRGFVTGGTDAYLRPNLSSAEGLFESGEFLANGFKLKTTDSVLNGNGSTYIYIAIRRPMKTPESGTEVFTLIAKNSTSPTTDWTVGFPADMFLEGFRTLSGVGQRINTRLTGGSDYLETWRSNATFDGFGGAWDEQDSYSNATGSVTSLIGWFFKRATGFFDVVAYTGTSSARTIPHNLGVVPEFIIVKNRDSNDNWICYHSGNTAAPATEVIKLNETDGTSDYDAAWNDTAPTSSVFTVGSYSATNNTGQDLIAYLFATLAGVSKVGSYTGTGSNVNVDCGFSAGARFILIKRSDSTGDWYVWDSERGIVAGNDPYLLLNTASAEVTNTDYIDPLSSGFTVTSSAPAALNASGGNYIFLAIA